MPAFDAFVDDLYTGQERLARDEIYRRAVAADLPAGAMDVLDRLPEGEYAQDELSEALGQIAQPDATPLSIDDDLADLVGEADLVGDDTVSVRTGAEQEWDPEDLVAAEGRDPTPANIERARRELAEDGPAAIERTVP
jgi:hypothetical protein